MVTKNYVYGPFKVALLTNSLIRFEVFIHKVDGLSDDTKEFRQ